MNWRQGFRPAKYWWEFVLGGLFGIVLVIGSSKIVGADQGRWLACVYVIGVGVIYVSGAIWLRNAVDRREAQRARQAE